MTRDKYINLKEAHWDGEAMVYSESLEKFYYSPDEAIEDLEEGQTIEYLMLVICEPVYARKLEIDDWTDDLGDSDEGPDWLEEAIEVFNQTINGKPPLSWAPGKTRLVM